MPFLLLKSVGMRISCRLYNKRTMLNETLKFIMRSFATLYKIDAGAKLPNLEYARVAEGES